MGNRAKRSWVLLGALAAIVAVGPVRAAEWGTLSATPGYESCFGLEAGTEPVYTVTMLESNAAGNVFHEQERPRFTFQIENHADQPLRVRGTIDRIRYAQNGRAGDPWWPELRRLEKYDPLPLEVDVAAGGWRNLTIEFAAPETMGGYGLVVDLGHYGRRYLTSFVRTFRPDLKPVQLPKQSLEEMPGPILARLGVQAIRWGVSYVPSDHRRYDEQMQEIARELEEYHANRVTVVAEIGAGPADQPLGRGRPHLDDKGMMQDGKQDLVWLPKYDDDYQQFVYTLASRWGWPKGPITGFMLWNEPWEGLSISGWGADIPRYRELYRRMGDAVFRARREAGADVLVGGCDSSANTIDKLFPDASQEFLPYLDFCSIHYQGLSAPVLYPEWNQRTHYKGRVLIWDTESWVANSDDRFAGVVATNRAAGYDRSMGTLSRIAVSTLSHKRIAWDTVRNDEGRQKVPRLIESRPLAAAYGAVQHFIGERSFRQILFQNGLPWVYVFDGLDDRPDDGTVIVVGDIQSLFTKGTPLLSTVRSLDEIRAKQAVGKELAGLAADDPRRQELRRQLREPMPFTGATMTLDARGKPFGLYDVYGNAVPSGGGKIVVPLNDKGFFLRADPAVPGSFSRLLDALRHARIEGIEPLEMIAYDMTAPIDLGPVLRLRLTNMLNRPLRGKLAVSLAGLDVESPNALQFGPREQKWIRLNVRGTARPDNRYPLSLKFDAGDDGAAVHEEEMHVNWISHKSIAVDGRLDDWKGAIPQTIASDEAAEQSFEEKMWMPFVPFEAGRAGGLAVGYLAYDDHYFYFAAKIADDTPHPGAARFATRDADADFYPQVSYEVRDGRQIEHVWPEGVRRFSYRRWPMTPSSIPQRPFDNVLIGFNALPIGEDGWLSHLPGRMPKFVWYKTTDYEYALNQVADDYGGGTEVFRLLAPGMPYKHFFPRQPTHPQEGPVEGGKLEVRYDGGTRIVECALPWSEIPDVKALLTAGRPVKFSFRVNDEQRGPDLELARGRSAAEGISHAFHPNWARSWPNELEFGFERSL